MVHDNQNRANRGDTVIIEETRPLSSRKHWSLNSILIKKENFEK
jgi:ribosomal protein S17